MPDDHDQDRRPRIPSEITINVVISGRVALVLDGHAVVEILSSTGSDEAAVTRLVAVTARMKASADALKAAEQITVEHKP